MSSSSAKVVHEFVSHHCCADETRYVITVGFARDPADEESLDGLLLQRGHEATDDILGIRGVYVEIPIQAYVVYGGIIEAELRRNCFTLHFEEKTAQQMGGFQTILVHFDLPDEQFASIRDGLRYIFDGCSCYRDEL